MPSLDRRIVVRLTVTARNQFGESVETTTDYPQWATRRRRKPARQGGIAGGIAHARQHGPM